MFSVITEGRELNFKNLILELTEISKNTDLVGLVDAILDKSGLKADLLEQNSLESEIKLENLEEFKSIALGFQERGIFSLEDFLENISLVSDRNEYKEVENGVNLMTLHSAKGLEFNDVFLVGMEEGVFPHNRSFESESDLEEDIDTTIKNINTIITYYDIQKLNLDINKIEFLVQVQKNNIA